MSLHRGCEELLHIYQNRVLQCFSRGETHVSVARELSEHNLRWKRGSAQVEMFKGALDQLQLYVLRYGAEVDVTPRPFDDFALVHLSLRGGMELEVDGQRIEIAQGRSAVIAPKRSLRLHWYQGTEQMILKVPHALLRSVGMQEEAGSASLLPGYLLPHSLDSHWNLLMRSLLNIMRLPMESGPRQSWLEHFERNIGMFLLAHQPDNVAGTNHFVNAVQSVAIDDAGTSLDSKRMDDLLDYVNARLCAPLSLYDMAKHVGVSIRTLNALCHAHAGHSPMEFLRNQRLDAARSKLLLDPKTNVTDTATHYGFGHLGRFSGYYLQRFGELPRQTVLGKRLAN